MAAGVFEQNVKVALHPPMAMKGEVFGTLLTEISLQMKLAENL